ncbi:MAG: DUF4339 domain-containing protein [Verrucomicrobia bacterium]|nr:DUF4339 domain-containing protein [Verrucomicrobiota bacterium]
MSDYYLYRNNQPDGPHTVERLRELRSRGEITDDTPCCPNGASAWATVGAIVGPAVAAGPPKLPPSLPPQSAHPPLLPRAQAPAHPGLHPVRPGGLPQAQPAGPDFAHRFAGASAEVGSLAKLFASRILTSNFTQGAAREDERKTLESASTPVLFPIGQNYAAWRRAILWFSGVGLAIAALFQIGPTGKLILDDQNPSKAFKIAALALFALQVLAPALALLGALRWSEIRESRRHARLAYFCQLIGPMIIFCIPVATISARSPQEANILRTYLIIWALEVLFPKIFALFPGLIRACLTLRTLLPESLMPGWICMFVAPLYGLFCMVAVIIGAQSGNLWVFLGFCSLLLVPGFVLFDAKNLCAPTDEAGMNKTLEPLRMRIMIATVTCVVLVVVGSIDVIKQMNIGVANITNIVAMLIGNIFLLTLVASDFLTGVIRKAFEADAELDGTPLYDSLAERMAQLSNVRLADVSAGESMVVRNVGALLGRKRDH